MHACLFWLPQIPPTLIHRRVLALAGFIRLLDAFCERGFEVLTIVDKSLLNGSGSKRDLEIPVGLLLEGRVGRFWMRASEVEKAFSTTSPPLGLLRKVSPQFNQLRKRGVVNRGPMDGEIGKARLIDEPFFELRSKIQVASNIFVYFEPVAKLFGTPLITPFKSRQCI